MFGRNFDKLKTNSALKSRASCEKPPLIITIKISFSRAPKVKLRK